MKNKLAVFDIDGTVFRWTFISELLTNLTKSGVFSKSVLKQTEEVYFNWKDRKGSWDDYINTVVKVTNKALIGKDERQVDKVIHEIVETKKDNLGISPNYPYIY